MQLSKHRICLISLMAAFCALSTACDDDSTTAHSEFCLGPHCPCTVTEDCGSFLRKCYEGICYNKTEFCGEIVCSETQVCQDNACVDKTEQNCGDEVCGSNQKCYQNKCHDNSEFCGDTICSGTQTCQNGSCIENTDKKCGDEICEASQKCYEGACHDDSEFCGDIICAETQTCQNGSCIENTDKKCGDEICEASQKCYEGACHDDSEFCGDIICAETQTCQNGSCVDSTGESCGDEVCGNDQKCFEDACHDNSEFCGETICGETQTCQDGSCVDQSEQKCGDEECDAGQKCFEDACHDISEFCADVICSTNQECFEETCHDRCGDHICETDQKCWENNCYSLSAFCGNTVCDNEHACFEGKCVESDLICDDKLCQTGQKCFEKVCHDDKDFCGNVICGKNQTCVEELCIDDKDLCGGILCEADQKCYQNKCHDDTEFCDKVICGKDQACVNKKCIDNKDLCKDTVCSTNQKCYQDKCYDTSEFCGDIICTKDQVCENKKCITPVKSIEFTTTDTKLFFNEELKLNVKVTPSNATDKTLVWDDPVVTGPANAKDKVFNKQTAMLTNRTLNVREVKLTVKSKANPSVTATKTIQFKPYTKDICIRDTSTDQCDKPRILHDANTRPYLPENAYDEETTKVFNRDIYTEYVSKYLQKSGSDEYGNRASVVIAARFLALQFPFYIRYYDNTHSVTKYSTESHYVWTNDDTKPTKGQDVRIFGLNLTKNAYNGYTSSTVVQNNVIPWSSKIPAASDRNEGPNGLACSGFVAWALRNGRFYIGDWWTHVFGNYGSCTVGEKKVRHYNCENYVNGKTSSSAANPYNSYDSAYAKLRLLLSTNQTSMCTGSTCDYKITDTCKCTSGKCSCACITDKIGGDTKDDAINDKTDFVNVKYIDDPKLQKKIKAGDLLWHGKSRCTGSGGHIAMILGIDRNEDDTIKWIYVAEAASGGTKVTRYSINFLQNCSGWSETICEKKDGKYVVKKNSDGSNYIDYNTDTGKPRKAYDSFIIRMDNIYNYYYKNGTVSEKGNEYKYKEIESFVTK